MQYFGMFIRYSYYVQIFILRQDFNNFEFSIQDKNLISARLRSQNMSTGVVMIAGDDDNVAAILAYQFPKSTGFDH